VSRRNYGLLIGCHSRRSVTGNFVAVVIAVVVVIVAVIICGCVWGRGHGGCWLADVETIP
jgi:hypothetical protein